MKKIVYLPLDERPCNYNYPYSLSRDGTLYCMVRPKLHEMGEKKTPAKYEKIANFLTRESRDADYLILAIDTLLYGGIVPSRLHHEKAETLQKRLSILDEIKKDNPKLKIFAFSLVMRCPCYTDNSEEPHYYGICGREIFLYGQNEHKYALGLIGKDDYTNEKKRLAICEPYIKDYTDRRKCNLSLFLNTLRLVGKTIDEFVILQDDSNPYGYTAMDQAKVRSIIGELGISVDIYSGADEGGMTLLSRVLVDIAGHAPKVFPVFPRPQSKDVIPIFEDRAVHKSISAQIRSAGAVECASEAEADILLFCNLNDTQTYDIYFNDVTQSDESYIPSFVDKMNTSLKKGRGVAVADIAYCNGSDITLLNEIEKKIGILKLWGYAGWNTSSNTLGTVICQAVSRYLFGDTAAHRHFTAERVVDDAVYSRIVRRLMIATELEKMGYSKNDTKDKRGEASKRILDLLNEYTRSLYPSISEKYKITDCYMPWKRLFEVGIEIKERQ